MMNTANRFTPLSAAPSRPRGAAIWKDDYERIIALSEKWGLNLRQTLEKVLAEHKRGEENKFYKPRAPEARTLGLSEKGNYTLKCLQNYYAGTQAEIVHYALETMEGD